MHHLVTLMQAAGVLEASVYGTSCLTSYGRGNSLVAKLSKNTTETVKITIQESNAGAEIFLCLIQHHTTKTYGGMEE
jgi:hypothetical protein